ncbi:MAG: CinA family protein [Candidatus Omnitrophota bacterium]
MILEKRIAKIISESKLTISVAESCTGGLLSHRLTNISGSSRYFILGIVAYSNQAKRSLLKISKQVIEKYGPVSREIAILLAKQISKIAKSDIGIGITGIAGPTGGSKLKPVGLIFIALHFNKKTTCKKFNFVGNRLEIKKKTADSALKLIEQCLAK